MIKKHRGFLYLFLSICILIQATLFPEKPAELLIYLFQPKLDGMPVIFSLYDHVRYLNIIVYCGLALSGTFLFHAAKLFSKYLVTQNERIIILIDIITAIATIALVFLCTVKVYHLVKRESIGLLSLSGQTATSLAALLICVAINTYRKSKSNFRKKYHNQKNKKQIGKDKSIKYNIEEIEELRVRSEKDRKQVIEEYKKGYHFLLFYGKVLIIILMVLSLEYLNGFTRSLPWINRTLVYAALGYLFFFLINFIELNFVAKKVIRDLIKDIQR
jgi:hypothetical protein